MTLCDVEEETVNEVDAIANKSEIALIG